MIIKIEIFRFYIYINCNGEGAQLTNFQEPQTIGQRAACVSLAAVWQPLFSTEQKFTSDGISLKLGFIFLLGIAKRVKMNLISMVIKRAWSLSPRSFGNPQLSSGWGRQFQTVMETFARTS